MKVPKTGRKKLYIKNRKKISVVFHQISIESSDFQLFRDRVFIFSEIGEIYLSLDI